MRPSSLEAGFLARKGRWEAGRFLKKLLGLGANISSNCVKIDKCINAQRIFESLECVLKEHRIINCGSAPLTADTGVSLQVEFMTFSEKVKRFGRFRIGLVVICVLILTAIASRKLGDKMSKLLVVEFEVFGRVQGKLFLVSYMDRSWHFLRKNFCFR